MCWCLYCKQKIEEKAKTHNGNTYHQECYELIEEELLQEDE